MQQQLETISDFIWFLSFPIDELGLLKLESRDGFVRDLISNIGENMQAHLEGGIAKDSLKESPFSFKPREDRLAMFHALATVEFARCTVRSLYAVLGKCALFRKVKCRFS